MKKEIQDAHLSIIGAAARLAERLHEGQVDKAGVDYFRGHLSAVAEMGTTWQEKVVGYLHDAVEDTSHTVEEVLQLLNEELPESLSTADSAQLATALQLLNHHNAPDRTSYIHGICTNPLATAVKIHDLTHNMELSRLSFPTEKDFARVDRYKKELEILKFFQLAQAQED